MDNTVTNDTKALQLLADSCTEFVESMNGVTLPDGSTIII